MVNIAGGNIPAATITPDATIFDMPHTAFEEVVSLNLLGTLLPSQVFGQAMVERNQPSGCIVNISSMSAIRAISRVVGYSAAKAGIDQLYSLVSRRTCPKVWGWNASKCDRARFLYWGTKLRFTPKCRWQFDRSRAKNHRAYPSRTLRQTGRITQHLDLVMRFWF